MSFSNRFAIFDEDYDLPVAPPKAKAPKSNEPRQVPMMATKPSPATTATQGPFYRVKMCEFVERCRHRSSCSYAHTPAELRKIYNGKDLTLEDFTWRTKMCDSGDLCDKSDCGYAHSSEELRKIPCRFQSFCREWNTTCTREHYFLHPEAQVLNKTNTSWTCAIKETRKNLEELDHKTALLQERLDAEIRADEEALAREEQAIVRDEQETRDLVTSLDELGRTLQQVETMLDAPLSRKRSLYSTDEEEEPPLKKRKVEALEPTVTPVATPKRVYVYPKRRSWADDSDDEEEDEKVPTTLPKQRDLVYYPGETNPRHVKITI
jgi:hypothetical protein